MRGFVLIAYCLFLLSTGFEAGSSQPAHLSHIPVHQHLEKSSPISADTYLVTDEMEDEDERINNALARKYTLLDLSLSPPDLFDLNYLNGFTKDRLSLGDLPDIYIAQRALRI